jgi:hypothetical protein
MNAPKSRRPQGQNRFLSIASSQSGGYRFRPASYAPDGGEFNDQR